MRKLDVGLGGYLKLPVFGPASIMPTHVLMIRCCSEGSSDDY